MLKQFARAAWPAFLVACVLELIVFGLVDPEDVRWAGQTLALERTTVYSFSFFLFWGLSFAGNILTLLLNCTACLREIRKTSALRQNEHVFRRFRTRGKESL